MSLLTSQLLIVVSSPGTTQEMRTEVRGRVDGTRAFFPVDAPVYVGNDIERPDPRGGTLRMKVVGVTVYDSGSPAVNHIEAILRTH